MSGKHLSAEKAKEILRHGSVRGHPLTERQKRYMGWVAGAGAAGTKSSPGTRGAKYGNGTENEPNTQKYQDIIKLLNERTEDSTRLAVARLEKMYNLEDPVGIFFDQCVAVPPAKEYLPYKTGYANKDRMVLCPDIMKDDFNVKTHSKTIPYNTTYVTHYAAVVLHEFGHVLDKRSAGTSTEKTADAFAEHFIRLAGYAAAA